LLNSPGVGRMRTRRERTANCLIRVITLSLGGGLKGKLEQVIAAEKMRREYVDGALNDDPGGSSGGSAAASC
jgi:hypothetical protein